MSIWKIVLAVIGGILAIWLSVWGIWGLGVATAGLYGRGEVHKQVNDPDFMIAAYDSFFNQYASIKALEGQIDELTATLALQDPGTREYNYTLTSLTGAKGLRHTAIQKYNADARKGWTEGQFRDASLPYQIPDTSYPE